MTHPFGLFRAAFAALTLLVATAGMAHADRLDRNVDGGGVAIHGYDPVAYFVSATAVKGEAAHAVTHDGATYHFASAANADTFRADPAKYAPAYGGYCAMGTAMGRKFDVDPTAWRIVDGTLYLNLNADVQNAWIKDIPGNIAQADENWPQIKDVPVDRLQ